MPGSKLCNACCFLIVSCVVAILQQSSTHFVKESVLSLNICCETNFAVVKWQPIACTKQAMLLFYITILPRLWQSTVFVSVSVINKGNRIVVGKMVLYSLDRNGFVQQTRFLLSTTLLVVN